jgi:DnaK suppressor protein
MATKTTKQAAQTASKKPAVTKTAAPAATMAKQTAAAPSSAKPAKAPATTAAQAAPKAATKPVAKSPVKNSAPAGSAKKSTAKAEQTPQPVAKPAAPQAAKPVTVKLQKWDEIRALLLEMKQTTLQEISRAIKSGSEAKVGEETTGDIYDQASSERDRELELILSDRERQKVHNIDDALLRMKEGEYGICEECDEEIPLGRLKAMPFTRHCVKCKSDLERLQAQTRRFEEDRAYREIPLGDEEEA